MRNNFLLIFYLSFLTVNAQLTVDNNFPNDSPVYLVNNILLGDGVEANNHVYQGDSIQIGFCGSLTTVSTFMNELYILTTSGKEGVTKERGYLYQYIVITFVTCQILGLILSFIFV